MKVAIIGATGYGGIELIRLLHAHPHVKLHTIYSSSQEGMHIATLYPHLQSIISYELQEIDIDTLAQEIDLVFMATPTGVSSQMAPKLLDKGLKVIDLSGDFRIQSPDAFEMYYKTAPGSPVIQQESLYGLTEWMDKKETPSLIANPGCFPTVSLLGLAPIMTSLQVDPSSIIIDAKTGVSGAGRSASEATHYPVVNDSIGVYKVNAHQHIPEIEEQLSNWNEAIDAITFTTHLTPMTRGIMATMYVTLTEKTTPEAIHDLFSSAYKDTPFVRVRPLGTFPRTKEVQGSNYCDIGIAYEERTNRVTIVSVIDNLVKGASGQAVQNMNWLCKFDEGAGLDYVPLYP